MAADVSACPSARMLERLLAEQLSGPERDSVETHVEACTACQQRLETLVAPTFRQAPAESRPPEPGPQPTEGFLSRLRELSPPGAGEHTIAPPPAAGGDARLEGGRLG